MLDRSRRWRRAVGAMVLVTAACSGGSGGGPAPGVLDAAAGAETAMGGAIELRPPPGTEIASPAPVVAFQDGDGAPWVRLEPEGQVYRARASTGRYGLAVVGQTLAFVVYAHADELPRPELPAWASVILGVRHRWRGEIRGVPAMPIPTVLIGSVTGGSGPADTFSRPGTFEAVLPSGLYDLLAHTGPPFQPRGLAFQRQVRLEADLDRPVDLGSGTVEPTDYPFSPPPGPSRVDASVELVTAGGARLWMGSPPGVVRALAPENLGPGDRQRLRLTSLPSSPAGVTEILQMERRWPIPTGAGASWSPRLSEVRFTLASSDPVRPRSTFTPDAGALYHELRVTEFCGPGAATVVASARWLGGRGVIELPDLGALAPSVLRSPVNLGVTLEAIRANRPLASVLADLPPTADEEITTKASHGVNRTLQP